MTRTSSFDHDEVVRLYDEEAMTLLQVAERFGVSESHIQKVIKKRAPGLLGRKRRPSYDVEVAMKLILAGETFAAVGRKFGVTPTCIHRQWRKRHPDVKMRTGPRVRKAPA